MDSNRSVTNPAVSMAFIRRSIMSNNLLIVSVAGLGLVLPALASDRGDDIGRCNGPGRFPPDLMSTRAKGPPHALLEKRRGVALVPGGETPGRFLNPPD